MPRSRSTAGRSLLELLFQEAGLPAYELPPALAAAYPGGIGFTSPVLYANFVSSLDGVVDIQGTEHVGRILSGGVPADKFTMGLLRACADAVLVGAGTLRASPDSRWRPSSAYPSMGQDFSLLRQRLGRAETPQLVLVTASGKVPLDHPGLSDGGLLVTTEAGMANLRSPVPAGIEVLALGESGVDWSALVQVLQDRGHKVVLSEAGPSVMGQLLRDNLVDELFLTVSPVVAGGGEGAGRPGFAAGVRLLPESFRKGELMSVHRSGSHLLLRYSLGTEKR